MNTQPQRDASEETRPSDVSSQGPQPPGAARGRETKAPRACGPRGSRSPPGGSVRSRRSGGASVPAGPLPARLPRARSPCSSPRASPSWPAIASGAPQPRPCPPRIGPHSAVTAQRHLGGPGTPGPATASPEAGPPQKSRGCQGHRGWDSGQGLGACPRCPLRRGWEGLLRDRDLLGQASVCVTRVPDGHPCAGFPGPWGLEPPSGRPPTCGWRLSWFPGVPRWESFADSRWASRWGR